MTDSMKQTVVPNWQEEPRNDREEDDLLTLRVGGQVFETSRKTLCADKDSMLAALVLRHWHKDDKNSKNSVIRIDRDGQRFAHVLTYLRSGTVWLQDVCLLRELQEEANFFCLSGLGALCEEKIQGIKEKEDAKLIMDSEISRKRPRSASPRRFSKSSAVVEAILKKLRRGLGGWL